jgi:hypothetical protein
VQKTAKKRQAVPETPQIRKPKARRAAQAPTFAPDRRRMASGQRQASSDEFDAVFGAPDVNSYFDQ